MLMKALVKQSIKDTIKEYNLQLKAELKEYKKLQTWNIGEIYVILHQTNDFQIQIIS